MRSALAHPRPVLRIVGVNGVNGVNGVSAWGGPAASICLHAGLQHRARP
jgi:hypothetical protein